MQVQVLFPALKLEREIVRAFYYKFGATLFVLFPAFSRPADSSAIGGADARPTKTITGVAQS